MESSKNVTLIAVSSNEAAYLTEWVHHHVYFGFKKIIIGINRNDDNSLAILAELDSLFPDTIEVINIDFIDKSVDGCNPRLQHIGYAYLVSREVESASTNQIMILDIDEFWTPKDFKTQISDYLAKFPNYDVLSFPWILEAEHQYKFSMPFSQIKAYYYHDQPHYCVKSLFKPDIYEDVEIFAPHRPKTKSSHWIRLNNEGEHFEPYVKGYTLNPPAIDTMTSFIFHRVKRSEVEYLASQNKPDNFAPNRPIKPKSNGYRNNFKTDPKHIFTLSLEDKNEYFSSLTTIMNIRAISCLIEESRSQVEQRALDLVSHPISIVEEYAADFLYKTAGTSAFDLIINRIERESKSSEIKQQKDKIVELINKASK